MYKKSNLGITLIALVITIIVLLILAGVTLSLTLGENGLLKRAEGSKEEYTKSSIKEELEMDITDMLIQKKGEELTKQEIADELGNKVIIENVTEDTIEGEYKDYEITIDKDNNVIVGDKLVGEAPKVEIKVLDTQEGIEKTSIQVIASITDGVIEAIEPLNGATLKIENSNADKIYEVIKNGTYKFKVIASNKRTVIASIQISNLLAKYPTLLESITDINESCITKVKVMGKTDPTANLETVEHSLNVMYYNKDLVLDGTTPVIINETIITPNNKTYEFGNINDVATSNTMAQNTVVLKVEGNLTINEGVKLTAIASPEGYGGPKGMVIYCTGELINNGEISMTARGAKAEGQNIYLWENTNGIYEYVSKTGAVGGAGYENSTVNVWTTGSTGVSGTLRQTGGGGAGGSLNSDAGGKVIVKKGGDGTSYSGGSGSGAINCNVYTYCNAYPAGENGGAGGPGRAWRSKSSWMARNATGGTGNPGGLGGTHTSGSLDNIGNDSSLKGNNGTGGLLVIFSSTFTNNGLISSMGIDSANVGVVSGGASGGGSINIFYNKLKNKGEFNVSGGKSFKYGGPGGAGTTTIGRIENGAFIKDTI